MATATHNEPIDVHGVRYTIVIHPAEEGGFWGEVLELPGCVSQGKTKGELLANIKDAIQSVTEPA